MKLIVLGSTGSIGRNTLYVAKKLNIEVVGLASKKNFLLLSKQIKEFQPQIAFINDFDSAKKLKSLVRNNTRIVVGEEGLQEISTYPYADTVMVAIVGYDALMPLLWSIKAKKKILLANKESLVYAGDIIMNEAKKNKVDIIPVDSEHSGIFQCLQNRNINEVKKVTLTASGGPLFKIKNTKNVSISKILKHPVWKMGKKTTVDSATLMNKGFEKIEAHYLFSLPYEKISILIHPQSVIHCLVEFIDGSCIAQLSYPDMRLPIQFAMTYPERKNFCIKRLFLNEFKRLEFYKPNLKKFPCLELINQAIKYNGTAPLSVCIANESSVDAFIRKRIKFHQIPEIIKRILHSHKIIKNPTINEIKDTIIEVRKKTENLIAKFFLFLIFIKILFI